ncbi:MAG: HAD-IA family hydrolase [Usitatibacteraceae bacterium]
MKNTKAILFDLGGVVCELRGEEHMMKLLGGLQSRDEMWRAWLSSPSVRAHESGRIDEIEFAKRVIAEFNLEVAPDVYLNIFRDWLIGPFPGAFDLLDRTKARYRTALLSNIGSAHWPKVETMDLLPRLHHAFPSFKLGAVKPDAAYFRLALDAMNVSPDEAIFFDDNQINCDGANAFGIASFCTRGVKETLAKLLELDLL